MGLVVKQRQERKQKLLRLIMKQEPTEADKLAALFSWKFGVTTKKVHEYLSELQALGAIKLNPVEATAFGKKLLET